MSQASFVSQACQSRSSKTAGALFERHAEHLLAFCQRRLGSRAEAEDAVQTTFVYALRALRRGVVPECEAAWLTAIAKNVCRWQRRGLARRALELPDADINRIGMAQPDDDEREVLFGLEEALRAIPESQRKALVLREWRGLPPREIASELGLSPTATHALLTRARHSLAHALTAARQPAVALAGLVVELRGHLKALLDGASAKTAVVAVAVVGGTGATGVVVVEGRASPAPARSPALVLPASEVARAGGVEQPAEAEPARETRFPQRSTVDRARPAVERARHGGALQETVRAQPGVDRRHLAEDPPAPPTETRDEAPSEPATNGPAVSEKLPALDLPPVDPPAVELPPEELPGALPPVDVPADAPKVDVPALDAVPPLPAG